MNKASISNHALQPLTKLIGEWRSSGTHPLVPDTTLRGHSSFKWIEGGAFLVWHSQMEHAAFPDGIAIFGSDDATPQYYMLYFDERNVSRKYDVSFQNDTLKWWRDAPGFSQRYTWTFTKNEGGQDVVVGKGELSQDNGITWKADLDLVYTRIPQN